MIKTLRKSDIRELNDTYGLSIDKKDAVRLDDGVHPQLLIINGTTSYFFHANRWVPTLKLLATKQLLKKIVVDMGAIPFLIKGADVMRPGIKKIEDNIGKDDYVLLVDEKYGKGIAVGQSKFSSEELKAIEKGKAITNRHYVGDVVWNYGTA